MRPGLETRGGPIEAMRRLLALVCVALLLCGAAAARGPAGAAAAATAEIRAAELPREARETLVLIRKGGPFPYRQDGTPFGNREKKLPPRERGYYREYTVPTPLARDRRARRIVAGRGGEYYYSDDHYNSFRRIRD